MTRHSHGPRSTRSAGPRRGVVAGRVAVVVACIASMGLIGGLLPGAAAQSSNGSDEVDVLTATREEVRQALSELDERYAQQQSTVDEARAAAAAANEQVERAEARVELARHEVEQARDVVREYAVEAYIRPPAQDALRVLSLDQADDAGYANSVIKILAEGRNEVVEILVDKQEAAARQEAAADEAAEIARSRASDAEVQLVELDRMRAEQQGLASSLDDRLDAALAEAAALAEIDRQMADELAAQELALRDAGPATVTQVATTPAPDRAAAVTATPPPAAPPAPSPGGGPAPTNPPTTRPPTTRPPTTSPPAPPSGTVSWSDVTNVGGIYVHTSIASNLRNLLNAATAAGFTLRGGGYRDSAAQVATRRANCGTSYYDIYQKPASQCSPPTAIPGRSMHEQGRAIDFTSSGSLISSRSNPAFGWLAANAAKYGFFNLPSEPWHWSTNGN